MEAPQAASTAWPRPDQSNFNNDNSAADILNDFEKEQAGAALVHAKRIINNNGGATKGKANALADLTGKHRVPYPSIETLAQPRPVDFALQGSDIYIISFTETHPTLNLTITCPNSGCDNYSSKNPVPLSLNGWSNARCCHGLDRTHYVVSRKYQCKSCQSEFFDIILDLVLINCRHR